MKKKKEQGKPFSSQRSDFYKLKKMCYPQMSTKSIYTIPISMNFSKDMLKPKFQAQAK